MNPYADPPPVREPMPEKKSGFVRFLKGVYLVVDTSAKVLFLAIFVGIFGGFLIGMLAGGGGPKVPSSAVLVLDLEGPLVEQLTGRSSGDLIGALAAGDAAKETLVRDVTEALDKAREDKRIKAVLLDLDGMQGSGLTKLQDVAEALDKFRKTGKKVIAAGDRYTQSQYFLAARADEVFMSEDGMVLLEGFGRYRMYYKDAIDRFGLEWNVFRVGEYKSFVEPYIRNDMSPEAKEADLDWMGDLWRGYLGDVATARKVKPEDITAMIEDYPARLKAQGGDAAKLALSEKLVDTLAPRDVVRRRLVELAGKDADGKSFSKVTLDDYVKVLGLHVKNPLETGDAVAVVVAAGEILDGTKPPGTIGGDSTAALIRKAREDDSVKAIVLRVDSPGGSAFASDVIRRELVLAREAKKPVVVSMGTVAASGGYWIATASDEIWVNPNTITGSIGIFGMIPTFGKALEKYTSIHVDGVGTTSFAGKGRLDMPLDPRIGEIMQSMIDHGYDEFLERVAESRKMTKEEVDKLARGRVWSGQDAKEARLVDSLGNLSDAISSAARRANLKPKYRVTYVEKDLTFKEQLVKQLLESRAVRSVLGTRVKSGTPPPVARVLSDLTDETRRVLAWNDPKGIYAHCLCEVK